MTEKTDKQFKQYYNVDNSLGELPLISITKRKVIGDFETETIDLCVKGYNVKECLVTLEKIKKLFDLV